MVTINNITPENLNGQDGTSIDYTVNFEGTNDNVTGTILATKDDMSNAFKIQNEDTFFGLKQLVLQRIASEAQQALASIGGSTTSNNK